MINEVANPAPDRILIVDDLLTGGSHFAGMKMVLARRFPDTPSAGLFLARRATTNAFDDPTA
jgi:hypothetical protein